MTPIVWSEKPVMYGYGHNDRYTIVYDDGVWKCSCHFKNNTSKWPYKDDAMAWCRATDEADCTPLFLITKMAYFNGSIVTNTHIDRKLTVYRGEEAKDKRVAAWRSTHPDVMVHAHMVELIGEWFYQGDVILADEMKILSKCEEPLPRKWTPETIVDWLASHNGQYPPEARKALSCLTHTAQYRQEMVRLAKERGVLNYLLPLIEEWLTGKDMLIALAECIQYVPSRVRSYRFNVIEAICNNNDLTATEAGYLIRKVVKL